MSVETIAGMTQSEFREMLETVVQAAVERTLLEMLGDPDEDLAIRGDVRKRLMRQRQEVAAGQRGQPFDADDRDPPDRASQRNLQEPIRAQEEDGRIRKDRHGGIGAGN